MSSKYLTIILMAFALSGHFVVAEQQDTGNRATEPLEIYGPENSEVVLTLGNGGAGPTCLLGALSEDFLATENLSGRIAWIQNISRNTLENLRDGIIDISLTYDPELEFQALFEGWASDRKLVFNDHFLIVGPKSNPAEILPSDSPEEAFAKIAERGAFLSRDDLSGSNLRERLIWQTIGIEPWSDKNDWYVTSNVFPTEALQQANEEGLYTLTDRGSLLAIHRDIQNTAVYVQENEQLMNRCHAMVHENPKPIALAFLRYLESSRAQQLITEYAGKDPSCQTCCPLFTPANFDLFLDGNCLKKLGFVPEA